MERRKDCFAEKFPKRRTLDMNEKVIVTIARQYGSGGREIGEKVAASLGIAC